MHGCSPELSAVLKRSGVFYSAILGGWNLLEITGRVRCMASKTSRSASSGCWNLMLESLGDSKPILARYSIRWLP